MIYKEYIWERYTKERRTIGYWKSPTRSDQLVYIKLPNIEIQFFISLELQN